MNTADSAAITHGNELLSEYNVEGAVEIFQSVVNRNQDSYEGHFGLFLAYAEKYFETSDVTLLSRANEEFARFRQLSGTNRLFPDDFEVQELVGVGAMSYVFKVRRGGAPQALKVLKLRFAASDRLRRSFCDEVKKLNQIDNANVVKVNYSEDLDRSVMDPRFQPFYVMEYVDGYSLKQYMINRSHDRKLGELALSEIVSILLEVTNGIRAAHKDSLSPIVHLDLKPENVLFDRNSKRWKIIDFGMALFHNNRGLLETKFCHTVTFFYSAPELFLHMKGTPRSDIYSLGKIMSEMLLGTQAVMDSRAVQKAFIRNIDFAYIIDTCTEVKPELRYQDCDELIADLKKLETTLSEIERMRRDKELMWKVIGILLKLLTIPVHPIEHGIDTAHEEIQAKATRMRKYYFAPLTVPIVLLLILFGRLLGYSIPTFGSEVLEWLLGAEKGATSFIPTFLVAGSFAYLASNYYQNVVAHTIPFLKPGLTREFGKWMSFLYALPIMVAVFRPLWWPFCSAAGVFFVFLNNISLFKSLRNYRQYKPDRNDAERQHLVADFRSWMLATLVYSLSLVLVGLLLDWLRSTPSNDAQIVGLTELILAVGVLAVNLHTVFNRTSGENGRRMQAHLLWEAKIRGVA